MELQLGLGLSLATHIENFKLKNNKNGFDHPKETQPWSFDNNNNSKRSFEEAFLKLKDASQALPLLLWSGQPNDDDDRRGEKKRIACSVNDIENDEKENHHHVVGWPPIKSWRKKVLHQRHQDGHIPNNRVVRNENNHNNNNGSNSIYVKVKMEGVAITRRVDLRLYHSYQTLTSSLITMFAKCHKLENGDSTCYTLTYQDKDGDWLLAGDLPWQAFIDSVQRLEIVRNGG